MNDLCIDTEICPAYVLNIAAKSAKLRCWLRFFNIFAKQIQF